MIENIRKVIKLINFMDHKDKGEETGTVSINGSSLALRKRRYEEQQIKKYNVTKQKIGILK